MAVVASWHDLYIEQVKSGLPPYTYQLETVNMNNQREKADLAIDVVVS